MSIAGGLQKVVRGFTMAFPGKKEKKMREYKDKFPKKLPTLEEVNDCRDLYPEEWTVIPN